MLCPRLFADWCTVFRPAMQWILAGGNPYVIPGLYSPPWALAPLLPIAWVDGWLDFVLTFFVITAIAWKLKASPLALACVLLSVPGLYALTSGNVEWLTLLGLVSAPAVGIVLLLTKPQMGIVAAVFLAFKAWRDRKLTATLLPLAAVIVVSTVALGAWWSNALTYNQTAAVNSAIPFPWGVPIGAWLTFKAWQENDVHYAIAASPFFFPTISPQVWLVVPLALVQSPRLAAAVSAASWVIAAVLQRPP